MAKEYDAVGLCNEGTESKTSPKFSAQPTGLLQSVYYLLSSQSFIHFWRAPLGVRSVKRRHLSPEWIILSHIH